jgi:hypothetical protein
VFVIWQGHDLVGGLRALLGRYLLMCSGFLNVDMVYRMGIELFT